MEQVLNGWQASEREMGCLNGSFPSSVLVNLWIETFCGVGWEVPAGLDICRKCFWLWNSIVCMCLQCYLKWKITSAGGMGMLLELQLTPLDCQSYCCTWALNSFWQTFTRLHLLLENSCSTLFPKKAFPKAFEDLPFSVLVASGFMEVHWAQKWNRAAI